MVAVGFTPLGEGNMSEVIRAGSFDRMDRVYTDVFDEVRIMAEAGDRNDPPEFVPVSLISRFLARFGAPLQAP